MRMQDCDRQPNDITVDVFQCTVINTQKTLNEHLNWAHNFEKCKRNVQVVWMYNNIEIQQIDEWLQCILKW